MKRKPTKSSTDEREIFPDRKHRWTRKFNNQISDNDFGSMDLNFDSDDSSLAVCVNVILLKTFFLGKEF